MPENKHYKSNYLKSVIFRLDYNPILLINKEIDANFQNNIRAEFPEIKEQKLIEREVIIDEENKVTYNDTKVANIWHFLDSNKKKKIIVANNYFVIEVLEYTHFIDYKDLVSKIYTHFLTAYKPINITRMGLRYVNEIQVDGNPFDWAGYIDPALIYNVNNFMEKKEELTRAMYQLTLKKDDYDINFKYGMFNSEYPAKISRKEFILDYDCYTKEVLENNVIEQLATFNTEITNLFEKSIGDKLRNHMEVINE